MCCVRSNDAALAPSISSASVFGSEAEGHYELDAAKLYFTLSK